MKKVNILILALLISISNLYSAEYASMYIANSSTNLISGTLTAGTELQVTGFSSLNCSSNWSVSSSALTPTSSATGDYLLRYTLSFTASEGAWTINIYKNGVKVDDLYMKRKNSDASGTDVGNASATGFVNISSSSDVITLKVSSDQDATLFKPIHAQVVLIPMGTTSTPSIGEMYIYNNSSTQTVGTSWSQISNFSAGENITDFTFASNSLTLAADVAGYYLVTLSTSFNASGPNDYDFGVSINGANPDKVLLKRRISGNQDYGNAVASGIVYLTGSDVVSIMCKADASGRTMKVVDANLTILRVDMDGSGDYANMTTTNNTSVNSIPANTWTKEAYLNSGSYISSNWSFSSSSLTPSTGAVGTYFFNYNSAVTYADVEDIGTYIYPIVGIFVNGVLQKNLTCQRKLQKKDNYDYGSISGTGFVRIESTSDVIEMKLYSSTGEDFLTLDANVNLYKLSSEINLPVELSHFDAVKYDDRINVNWVTESEFNNDYFAIERSTDAKNFKEIYTLKADGNSNSTKSYSYSDYDISSLTNTVYYRLKQVDVDGTYVYSNVVSVEVLNNNTSIGRVYKNQSDIVIEVNSKSENKSFELKLIDISGAVVYNNTINISKGISKTQIPISTLSRGIYIIVFSGDNESIYKKFVL
jgi:hypothetical protein